MLTLPWVAIFLAAPATWLAALRWLGLALLVAGYGTALINGQLGVAALIPIALLAAAAWWAAPPRPAWLRCIGHLLFVVLAIALLMHWLPGFHNWRVIDGVRTTPDAQPFTMYLNFDKPLVGFWLLLVLPWIRPRRSARASLPAGLAGMLLTAAVCLAAAAALGKVHWAPKWPDFAWLFLANNLLLVTLTEEALFRGYLQGGLERWLAPRWYGNALALALASVLFGLAHAAGGWQWMVLGTIAGCGYGLAYRHGGLQAAVLAHFGLNLLHFTLFTYPSL